MHDQIEAKGFPTFIDVEDIGLGSDWAATIVQELESSSYLVLLLSEEANVSEMVIKEVEIAHQQRQRTGKPIILPIRVNMELSYPLNARLHATLSRLQQLQWRSENDNDKVLEQIRKVLLGEVTPVELEKDQIPEIEAIAAISASVPPTPVAPLEIPRGAVRPDSKFYVKRQDEDHFIAAVEQAGAVLRIRGPRQYGKTSLLTRVMAHASQDLGYKVVSIDFQELDEDLMQDLPQLLEEFCYYFAEPLDIEDECEEHWERAKRRKRPAKRTTTSFVEKYVLNAFKEPILLALDESDRLFNYKSVSSEFFLLLRSWHEKSKNVERKEWEKFKLCLCYSTEAKLAIHDLNASPFNVGEEAKLLPFRADQVAQLAIDHAVQLETQQLTELMELLGGQPYLMRRALYLLAKGMTFEELIATAPKHDGPFSDHLRHHLINVRQYPECVEALKEIIRSNRCRDPLMATRLEATGLTKGNPPDIQFACELYRAYFRGKI